MRIRAVERYLDLGYDDRLDLELGTAHVRVARIGRVDIAAGRERVDLLHAGPSFEVSGGVDGQPAVLGAELLADLVAPDAVRLEGDRSRHERGGTVLLLQLRLARDLSRGRHGSGAAARPEPLRRRGV